MTDLNQERVRRWLTFPYGPRVPRADFRALAESWLGLEAAARRVIDEFCTTSDPEVYEVPEGAISELSAALGARRD